jgi:hypothetical protein
MNAKLKKAAEALKPLAKINAKVKIKFAAKHLPRAALFMATGDIRYYLNGIRIEPAPQGGVYIIGCDGHCLAIIHDKDGTITGSQGVILRVSPGLLQACKAPGRELRDLGGANVIITGSRVSVAADFKQEFTDLEVFVQAGQPWIEGKYPDYARVLPNFDKLEPGFSTQVNSDYLARFSRLKPDGGDKFAGLQFWQEKCEFGSNPVLVQHIGIPEFMAIVMPIHTSTYDLDNFRKLFGQFPKRPAPEPDDVPAPGKQPSDAAPVEGGA